MHCKVPPCIIFPWVKELMLPWSFPLHQKVWSAITNNQPHLPPYRAVQCFSIDCMPGTDIFATQLSTLVHCYQLSSLHCSYMNGNFFCCKETRIILLQSQNLAFGSPVQLVIRKGIPCSSGSAFILPIHAFESSAVQTQDQDQLLHNKLIYDTILPSLRCSILRQTNPVTSIDRFWSLSSQKVCHTTFRLPALPWKLLIIADPQICCFFTASQVCTILHLN